MSADLDRFDRMLLDAHPASPTRATYRTNAPPSPNSGQGAERSPVIHSRRPARYVDHMACPMCGIDRMGIEYHGELMSGAKVHQLGAHSAGVRSVQNGQPRCLGAAMRVEFVGGEWRGVRS